MKDFPDQSTLLEMEMEVMKMIATDQPLVAVLDQVSQNFEKNIEGAYCSILLMDKAGKHVLHGSAPSLPKAYSNAIHGLAIGEARGSCGSAAYKKERIIVSDIANDPLWVEFKDLALTHGLKACWSTPILRNNGEVLGTFAIYYKSIHSPDPIDLELIDRSVNQVKIAIEQHYSALDLAESEEKYRTLAEGVPDSISRYDNQIRLTYVNPTVLRLLGVKAEDIIGKTHSEMGLEAKQVKFRDESIKSVFETGKPLHTQFEWRGKGGKEETLHFDWRLSPEFDPRGNVISVLGVGRDITELKNAESEIAKREKFLAVITDNFPNSFVTVVDKDLRVVFTGGDEFTKANLDSELFIGKLVADLFMEYGKETTDLIVDAYLKTLRGEPQEFELNLSDRHLLYKTVPLITSSSEINSLLVVVEDITIKRKAETALINSELLFTKLTTNAPVGIFQTDMSGGVNYVNEELTKYSGLSYEETMGDGWAQAVHPTDQGRVLIEWQQAVSNKREFKSEFRFITPQGKVTWLDARAVILFDQNDEPYGYIGMALDVSDQKSISGLLEENEKRYRTTLERITDGFVALDNNWCYTYMNRKASEIFECDPHAIVGKHIWTEFPEGIGQPFHIAYEKAMETQKYVYLEEYYPPYDMWFENHIYPSSGGLSIYFKDVTQRKRDELKVIQAMEGLELAEEQAMLGSWEFNFSLQKRLWSKQMFRLFGFNPQLVAPSYEDLMERIHPEDRNTFEENLKVILDGGDPEFFLMRTNPAVLSLRYLLCHWSVEYDEKGNPAKSRGTVQDITDRIISEQKTRESEEKYRTLVDQASDGIFIINPSLRFVQVNKMACSMLGYAKEELFKLSPADIIIFNEKDPPFRFSEVKEDTSLLQERTLKRNDGTSFPVEVNATRLKNGNTLSIVRDITERKNAERALAESENRLRTILDNEPECVKILNKRGELVDMNPAGLAMIGAENLGVVRGKSMVHLINAPYKEAFIKLTQNVFKGISGKLEFEITGLKGRQLWLETHSVPFRDSDGKIVSLLGVTRDITERKNAETKIDQYTKQLKELTVHLQHVREEERAALSRELHDELGQQLTAIKMDLSWLNKRVGSDELTSKLQETMHLTLDAVSTVRRINSELRPSLLDDLGLF
ncbi:MAG: PAS domain S-box protein, partial [Cyclobacteriaceae bacterium]